MGMPPIYRLKHWLADKFADKPRPAGLLPCAACHADVSPGHGTWWERDKVVTCSDACADDWAVDRSY